MANGSWPATTPTAWSSAPATAWALANYPEIVRGTLAGALERRESRGCHIRSDFPAIDPALGVNIVGRLDGPESRVVTTTRAVPPVPAALEPWLRDAPELDAAGRLLE